MARSWVPCYILNNILNPVRGLRDLQIDNACGSCYAHKTYSIFILDISQHSWHPLGEEFNVCCMLLSTCDKI